MIEKPYVTYVKILDNVEKLSKRVRVSVNRRHDRNDQSLLNDNSERIVSVRTDLWRCIRMAATELGGTIKRTAY